MKNKLTKLIKRTGSYNGELPEYNFIRLGKEYEYLFDDSDKEEKLWDLFFEIDDYIPLLVTRAREGKLNAIHVTSIENGESISKFGLKIPQNDNIPNLDKGIYCIRDMNYYDNSYEPFGYDGHENLSEWVCDMNECFEGDGEIDRKMVSVVKIEYTGSYDECVFGDNHVGYIAIRQDISPCNIQVENMSISDFLDRY